jgi:hypothetical protein
LKESQVIEPGSSWADASGANANTNRAASEIQRFILDPPWFSENLESSRLPFPDSDVSRRFGRVTLRFCVKTVPVFGVAIKQISSADLFIRF